MSRYSLTIVPSAPLPAIWVICTECEIDIVRLTDTEDLDTPIDAAMVHTLDTHADLTEA